MRISTSQMFRQSVDAMLQRQLELTRTEQQVSSGKRILRPSDDPSAAVRVLETRESAQRLAQYQRNADVATARLAQEETALIGIQDLLQRVRELAVQGNSDTLGDTGRTAIAAEVSQHLDTFVQLVNAQDANGEYLFAGFQSRTRPLTHDGAGGFSYIDDSGQRLLKIADFREIAISDPSDIFKDLPAESGGSTDVGSILFGLAANLGAGQGDADAIADIDTALDRILVTRAKVGARMVAIDDQKQANEATDLALATVRSSLEDLDYAEAISRFNQQLAALQASQQSFLKIQELSLFNFIR